MIGVFIYILFFQAFAYAITYDYIIVGSGSAGSVVAHRLSEDPSIKVLLLEAGGMPNLLSQIPLFSEGQRVSQFSWNYTTVPQEHSAYGLVNRISVVPRGKVLGGSSTINANLYTRGNKKDYDRWAEEGAVGWDWKSVFPSFIKHEDNGYAYIAANGYHNVGGEQPINFSPFFSPMTQAYLKAAELLGYKTGDFNGENQTVFMPPQGTVKKGRRWSGFKSFIEPIIGRRNIHILTSSFVIKILIDEDKRAYGVVFERDNDLHRAIAKEEVILCGGVFNSAQLLMLSGIGPKEQLEKLNIPVISDLPVGKNLQDHPITYGLIFKSNYSLRLEKLKNADFSNFLIRGAGPLASFTGTEAIGFIKSKYALSELPDIEILWSSLPFAQNAILFRLLYNANIELWKAFKPYSKMDVLHCCPFVLRPKSVGEMWLASANPYEKPLIDPKYYSHPHDIKIMVEGMKFCLKMAMQEPMRIKGVVPIPLEIPGCGAYAMFSDEYLACVARVAIASLDHFAGTCKMGDPTDPTTVVDPSLRVKGIDSLRVIDASVMPSIISGHTHAPAAMIGEKGASIVLQELLFRRNFLKYNFI